MSSNTATKPPYSLTHRLAVRFALTTSAIIALYALWSGYFVFDNLRDDLHAFLDHETAELAHMIRAREGQDDAIQQAVFDIASVTEEPSCAFRVRDESGTVIAAAGDATLLAKNIDAVQPGTSWRRDLFTEGTASRATPLPERGLTLEVLVDLQPMMDDLLGYALWSLAAFATAIALAALNGWLTASRGLRGLRQMARQAQAIDPVTGSAAIHLEGAPSEIREVGAALNEMLKRIDTGLGDMRTFTAGLAHELRSPLQNLIGETEVALLSRRTPEEYVDVLSSNLEDFADLTDAVDNLVTFCRTTEPEGQIARHERFDLAEEARIRLKRESRSADRAGIELQVEASGDSMLYADREGCLRVLRNLVRNAITWSPRGTQVRVRILGEDAALRVIVEDEGPGIPDSLGARAFEPFVSGNDSGNRGGYGLGLAICRSIMSQAGGRIDYAPRPEGGARFTAEFPRPHDTAA
jgi:two-component system heavy metal sensor histidine kinase CusS